MENLNKGQEQDQDPEQDQVQVEYQDQDNDQDQVEDQNQDQDQDQDTDQKVWSFLPTRVENMANERSEGQEVSEEDTEEEHRASEDPAINQEIKFKRNNLEEKFYMTRPGKRYMTRSSYMTRAGKRAVVQGTQITMVKRVRQRHGRKKRADKGKVLMTRGRKRNEAGKRDKMFMIRAGKRG